MSRRRYISTDISLDSAVNRVAQVSDFAALFYTWLIPHAKDDATVSGDPERLLAEVVPHRRDKTVEDIIAVLEVIEAVGLFEWWDRDELVIYFEPRNFYRYQSYIKAENRRTEPAISEERRKSAENAASLSLSLSPSLSFPPSFPKDKPLSLVKPAEKSIPESVLAYWLAKARKEQANDDELNSLMVLCKNWPAAAVGQAIGQCVMQGHPATNFAYITAILKGMAS